MPTDDELSLAEKVAKFSQHKHDQVFAGYTQRPISPRCRPGNPGLPPLVIPLGLPVLGVLKQNVSDWLRPGDGNAFGLGERRDQRHDHLRNHCHVGRRWPALHCRRHRTRRCGGHRALAARTELVELMTIEVPSPVSAILQ